MARFQFEQEPPPPTNVERATQWAQIAVRGGGFLLLIIGLWIALAVIAEAWSLYRHPAQITRFADAIERGSNLDHTLAKASQGLAANTADEQATATSTTSQPNNVAQSPVVNFRLSYFAAWFIAILLLMLVGRLAIAAVKTGGELVLYDLHIKRFVRELLREAGGIPRG